MLAKPVKHLAFDFACGGVLNAKMLLLQKLVADKLGRYAFGVFALLPTLAFYPVHKRSVFDFKAFSHDFWLVVVEFVVDFNLIFV